MLCFHKVICLILFVLAGTGLYCQPRPDSTQVLLLTVVNEKLQPADGATVKLLKNQLVVKAAVANNRGIARFEKVRPGAYTFLITYTGYAQQASRVYNLPSDISIDTIKLRPLNTVLKEVSIAGQSPPVQMQQGKTIINVDASVTNTGSTVLEVLEKSPGITVDRNGAISLQGKAGVLVMIDDKPTYLAGADLNNLLSSMSSSQVSQIELIANPTAKYDASGNAGIINIKTKKNKVRGFNGSFTVSAAQGVYPKSNNSLLLNYRIGRVNAFFNYNINAVQYLTDLYALRKYYGADGAVTSMLRQPSYFKGTFFNNNIKTGLDYYVTPETAVGIVLGGTVIHRQGDNTATATWLDPAGQVDSAISTGNKNNNRFKNGSVNLNVRHT
ncbi:MAG: hypothetical protein ACXVJD_12000, partial [Mucilaginibacter sp.]